MSSTEAEYIALSTSARDVIWCRTLLSELGFTQESATTIYEDNESCIKIATSPRKHPGVKHIEVRYHFIKDKISSNEIYLQSISTDDMIADLFTKQLSIQKFERHRESIRLVPVARYL